MCELMGMSANVPTDICFSFTGFISRGGQRGPHKDGWGITFYEGKGCRTFKDPQPSFNSPIARLVQEYPIKSCSVVAHIRQANRGEVALENTHPFMREQWGRYWIFAHNGDLENFSPVLDGSCLPVGNTDSERAFCWILQTLRQRFGNTAPAAEALFDAVREIALELGARGEFNFLLAGSDCLIAHASTQLSYVVRQAPFTQAHLKDEDVTVDFSELTTEKDRVAVIATVPLTDNEAWQPMPPGTLWLFSEGSPTRQATTVAGAKRKPAGVQERS